MADTQDECRLKRQIVDSMAYVGAVDDILTNPDTDDLPLEDEHENQPEETK